MDIILINDYLNKLKNKDIITYKHSINVGRYAMFFSRYLGMNKKDISIAKNSGYLHDIGKLYIDNKILCKKGKLTKKEFEEIKKHPKYGYNDIIKKITNINNDEKVIIETILHHHERYDKHGYPDNICLSDNYVTQIVSICDTFDAIISQRSYKRRQTTRKALEIINNEKKLQFESSIVNEFYNFINNTKIIN